MLPVTAEDLIVSIFYHLKQHSKSRLTADRQTLHQAFFSAKERHPSIMGFFSFREREQFPESSELDQALSNLDAAGLISRQNLTPKYYRFEDPLAATYVEFSKQLLEKAGIADAEVEALSFEIEAMVLAA